MKPCTSSDFAPPTPLAAAAAAAAATVASTHALGSTNSQYSTKPWTNQHHTDFPQTSLQQQQQQQQDPTTMAGTAAIWIMSQDHNAKTSML